MYKNIAAEHSYIDFFESKLKEFGGFGRNNAKKYVLRQYVKDKESFPEKGAYFGCINDGEEASGAYSDLCVVIFPSNESNDADDRWIISLAVGSMGFKNDYNIVSLPGTRRMFIKYLDKGKETFIKSDFMDIENSGGFNTFFAENEVPDTLANAVKGYEKVVLAATLFDPNNEAEAQRIISRYLAIYAKHVRNWPNKSQDKEISKLLKLDESNDEDVNNVKELVKKRRFVVLQGAPGTGKTRLAKSLPSKNDIVFFTQFHAETTYSDFVYGIFPDVESENLKYSGREGVFVKAIKEAQKPENANKNVYLIIDEINRANLANVLGPAFYLFEPTMVSNNIDIEVCKGLSLCELPKNLYVIATMNTADRSLAVVDFALRRRFAWYTLFPHKITADAGKYFDAESFKAIADIFDKYASDEELNLQPGHAYFIVPDDERGEIKNRLKYEIMPLIKEYLLDGMLSRAKDDFINYFRTEINEEMFK